ncbi:MAG: hypothetical protein JNL25_07935 [Rhodospirillaceae bacterium]|nr:hypothetical protein [Rhodospirillaceae bacterium]
MNVKTLSRMTSDFCRVRIASLVPPLECRGLESYLLKLIERRTKPPKVLGRYQWGEIAADAGAAESLTEIVCKVLTPVLDMLSREIPRLPIAKAAAQREKRRRAARVEAAGGRVEGDRSSDQVASSLNKRRRGVKPRPVIEFPEPLFDDWDEPKSFQDALNLHMRRFGDTAWALYAAIVRPNEVFDRKTLSTWRTGLRRPRGTESFKILARIERRYRLAPEYFKGKLDHPARSALGFQPVGIGQSERRRLAWHLPDDFNDRPLPEQEEILEWVRKVVVSGATDFRSYQATAMKSRFGLRFRGLVGQALRQRGSNGIPADASVSDVAIEIKEARVDAPPELHREMKQLLDFKTATLGAAGYKRNGVWGAATAAQKVEHLGLMLGAIAASPSGAVRGYGVPLSQITLGLLISPAVWDWYLTWREARRGFFTNWEVDMLRLALALTREETGWLRQNSSIAEKVTPIEGLVSVSDVASFKKNWVAACDALHIHAGVRVKEIARVARVHRDPFEPILPILEADSPVAEYRKIADEVLRLAPDPVRYPVAAAETARSLLLLRLGLHLGVRQKNLRQLLFCPRGRAPLTERQMIDRRRGELRWSDRDGGWEVVIPSIAFKNSTSSYFGNKPYRLLLPDLAGLYGHLEAYMSRHRQVLLRRAPDPGTFFIKTVKATSANAEYDQSAFYEAWRLTIQRYGVFNPYTGRGAIKGLLPHGPHNVRDVLATHILKKTGSFEQASYAIQDTPDMVAKHYGRFLPQDKAALAAKVLNKAWED